MLGFALGEPGDGVLVSRPMYGRFELDYGVEADIKIIYADTEPEEGFTPAVVPKFEAALRDAEQKGVKIRAVLIANPNNPVGKYNQSAFHPILTVMMMIRPLLSSGDPQGDLQILPETPSPFNQ